MPHVIERATTGRAKCHDVTTAADLVGVRTIRSSPALRSVKRE
jgi:hypothetical protein